MRQAQVREPPRELQPGARLESQRREPEERPELPGRPASSRRPPRGRSGQGLPQPALSKGQPALAGLVSAVLPERGAEPQPP